MPSEPARSVQAALLLGRRLTQHNLVALGGMVGGRDHATVIYSIRQAEKRLAQDRAFADTMPPDVRVIALVDFENDSVSTALAVARDLGERLHGVRLDTSESLVDESIRSEMGDFDPRGVNPRLVENVRNALDAEGFHHVQIVVSGGFTVDKIRQFEGEGVPVDSYGVGSSLIRDRYDFTADVVRVGNRPVAKVGRFHRPNPRLERVE